MAEYRPLVMIIYDLVRNPAAIYLIDITFIDNL